MPTKTKSSNKSRYKDIYSPIENKIERSVNRIGYNNLPSGTRSFLDSTMGQFEISNDRNLPPIDNTIKAAQKKILNSKDSDIDEILKTDWKNTKDIFDVIKNKPKSVSIKEMYDYYKYYNDMQKKGYTMATGGQLKAQNNAGMNPYLYNSLPQYGLGSWLAENAGTIGSIGGGIVGSIIPGAGTALGAAIGGGLGSMITNTHNQGEANDQKAEQVAMQEQQMSIQNAMNNYNAQQHPMYGTNFAMGGMLNSYACGGKFANGGQIGNDNKAAQMTKGLDNITVYPKSAGSHQSNPLGGITVGKYGQTEGSEVRVGKYVFSNRLPYKK